MDTQKLNQTLITLSNVKKESKVFNLYRLFKFDALWYMAYQNIYSNRGAFTRGVDDDTLDGFDKIRLQEIKDSLFDYSYKPTPVRRTYIPKANGKTRPLGIPNGTDKLVQEACRIILEAVYESKFSDLSHGFRPNRSCHTALKEVSKWTGTKWFIEIDIKGYFDNVDHKILVSILESKIGDKRFIELIRKFLNAGYMEDWKYHKTYSGTPQGGIISPILANIYLDKFDKWIESKCDVINSKENNRQVNPEYYWAKYTKRNKTKKYNDLVDKHNEGSEYLPKLKRICKRDKALQKLLHNATENWYIAENGRLSNKIPGIYKKIEEKCGEHNLHYDDTINATRLDTISKRMKVLDEEIKEYKDKMKKVDSQYYDNGLNRLKYVRYADDFILGYIGEKEEAKSIMDEIKVYLKEELNLDISEEKTNTVHANEGIEFLGYNISKDEQQNKSYQRDKNGTKRKRSSNNIRFKVPVRKAIKFVKDRKYGDYVNNESTHKGYLVNFDIYEIIKQYNTELRGLMQYYKYANNAKDIIGKVQWLAHYSMLKTIAGKRKCTISQVFKKNIVKTRKHGRTGKVWYYTIPGTDKEIKIFNIKDVEYENLFKAYEVGKCNDLKPNMQINLRNSAVQRLIEDKCELCGKTEMDGIKIHFHHKNPCRNIPETDPHWKQVQKMRSRKTVALCEECHKKMHHG